MMKNKISVLLLALFSFSASAQTVEGFEAILLVKEDSQKLLNAYISPAMKGLVYSMNGGWYHTAKVHKKFGFDITIGANAAMIPSKDEVFSLSALNLTNTITSTNDLLPTVAGEDRQETVNIIVPVTYNGNTVNGTANITLPGGIKDDVPFTAIPSPTLQVGIGLPVINSDIMVRFVPEVGSEDVKAKLFGIGVKHDLMQYFGPLDKLPLHISAMIGYTSMDVNYDIQRESSISGANQKANFNVQAYNVQAIASLNFPIINFYGGVGYAGGSTNLDILGTYDLQYTVSTGQPAPNDTATVTETLTNPIGMETTVSGVRATIGLRLSLGPFKIYGDYTVQEYSNVSAGIALSFR